MNYRSYGCLEIMYRTVRDDCKNSIKDCRTVKQLDGLQDYKTAGCWTDCSTVKQLDGLQDCKISRTD
jgi:hypothetical protein